MEIVIAIAVLALVVVAGVVIFRNKNLQRELIALAKEIQANPEVQAAEKKLAKQAASKAASAAKAELAKATKKK